jgi:hypothetical protein
MEIHNSHVSGWHLKFSFGAFCFNGNGLTCIWICNVIYSVVVIDKDAYLLLF